LRNSRTQPTGTGAFRHLRKTRRADTARSATLARYVLRADESMLETTGKGLHMEYRAPKMLRALVILALAMGPLTWGVQASAQQCQDLETVEPLGSGSLTNPDGYAWDVAAPQVRRVTATLRSGRTVSVILRNRRADDHSFVELVAPLRAIGDKVWVESSRDCGGQWFLACFSSSGYFSKPVPNRSLTTRACYYAADTGEYVCTSAYSEDAQGESRGCSPPTPSQPADPDPGATTGVGAAVGSAAAGMIAALLGLESTQQSQGSSRPEATADGTLVREPDGTIAVLAGGAPFSFASMVELETAGYARKPFVHVPAGYIARLPKLPRDRTLLRDRVSGTIAVITGGAKVQFISWPEYVAAGYERATFTNVAARHIASIGDVPRDGTLLRDPATGTIAIVAGGARFMFVTWDEYVRAGYERAPFTNVPLRAIEVLGQIPRDGTLLHDKVTGTIAVIAGNAKFPFATWSEYVASGYQRTPFTTVPLRIIQTFSDVPLDGTLLRDPASGTIVSVVAGTKYAFRSWEEYVAAGYSNATFTNVPVRFIDAIPSRSAL
jgi:hypothetical protein